VKYFSNFGFKIKLISLCFFLCSVSVVIGTVSYFGMEDVEHDVNWLTDKSLPKLEYSNDMFLHFRQIRIDLRTLGLVGLDEKDQKKAIAATIQEIEKYEIANQKYVALGITEDQKKLYENVNDHWKTFKAVGEKVLLLHKSGTPEDKSKILGIFLKDCPEAANQFAESMDRLLSSHREKAQMKALDSKAIIRKSNLSIFFVSLIGILFGLGFGYYFSNLVSNSLVKIAQVISANSESVASASVSIASSSKELSQAAIEQAAFLQETSSAVEQLNAMVAKNTENAEVSASTSAESQNKANQGKEAVEKMINSVEDISSSNDEILNQVRQSNMKMFEIVKLIEDIGQKTKVINDIVFQTKLLSFNASVEAARAGEHGKGFAVVAEEIGNLAHMSGQAANEISLMLESSVNNVKDIAKDTQKKVEELVDNGRSKINLGTEVAHQCSEMLTEIVSNVNDVTSLAGEISTASKEQSQGINEINSAVIRLNKVTQQNTSATNQTADEASQLLAQSQQLKQAVDELVSTIYGNKSA